MKGGLVFLYTMGGPLGECDVFCVHCLGLSLVSAAPLDGLPEEQLCGKVIMFVEIATRIYKENIEPMSSCFKL